MRTTNPLLEPQITTRFVPDACGPAVRLRSELDACPLRAAAANGFGDAGEAAALHSPPPPLVQARAPASVWQRLRRFGAELIRNWLADRRLRAESATLARLDTATLRDLGIDHSEIGSYAMESRGTNQPTRRRVVNRQVLARSLPSIKRVDEFL